MKNTMIEAVGVFVPIRKVSGVEYVVLMPDNILPLQDGQTVKVTIGQVQAQISA
jgi:hypothetical protein